MLECASHMSGNHGWLQCTQSHTISPIYNANNNHKSIKSTRSAERQLIRVWNSQAGWQCLRFVHPFPLDCPCSTRSLCALSPLLVPIHTQTHMLIHWIEPRIVLQMWEWNCLGEVEQQRNTLYPITFCINRFVLRWVIVICARAARQNLSISWFSSISDVAVCVCALDHCGRGHTSARARSISSLVFAISYTDRPTCEYIGKQFGRKFDVVDEFETCAKNNHRRHIQLDRNNKCAVCGISPEIECSLFFDWTLRKAAACVEQTPMITHQ